MSTTCPGILAPSEPLALRPIKILQGGGADGAASKEATRSNIIDDVLDRAYSYTPQSEHVLLRMSMFHISDTLHREESVYKCVAHDGPIKTCSILLIDAD